MDWLLIAAFLGWPAAWYLGFRMRELKAPEPSMDAPPGAAEDRFLVVARLGSGARARQMFERATVAPNEAIELWDGLTCRGRKGSPEA